MCGLGEDSGGSATGGSSRSPFRSFVNHQSSFLQHQDGLPAHWREEEEEELGREAGGQQGGKFHRCGLFCQIKRVSNNIQQTGPPALPVARCRCALKL